MRVLVIGPGALGIVAAVRLHRAGHNVEVAVRNAAKAKRLHASGFQLTDPDGRVHRANIPCVHNPRRSGPYDAIVHTTKCAVAADVAAKWLPTLTADGLFIPFQNGVQGDEMATVVGPRFMECSVYWPATLTAEGATEQMGKGPLIVGPWPSGTPSLRHHEAAELLNAIAPTQVHGNMAGVKWSKLAINAAMTSCGVVSGSTLGEMIDHAPSNRAFLGVMRETLAVMKAAGIPFVRVGPIRTNLLAKLPTPLARAVLRLVAKRYGRASSSSSQSLARGEPTEVDALNGLIVETGERCGVPTPINAAVVATVHAIEAERAHAGLETVTAMMRALD